FEVSSTTDLQIGSAVFLASAVFATGGSAYEITLNPDVAVNFWGGGAINNSGQTQTFVLLHSGFFDRSTVIFRNSATAGNLVTYENAASLISFLGTTSAGSANFVMCANNSH